MGVVVLVGLLTNGSAVAAVEDPPVAFVDSAPLNTSCADLAEGQVKVAIRNETATAQEARLLPQLVNESGNPLDPQAVCGKVTWTPETVKLGPAATATITFDATESTDARALAGSLALYSDSGRVSRKDVTIETEQQGGGSLEAKPLIGTASADFGTWERGPVWVPVEGTDSISTVEEAETEPETVGAVSGPDGPVAVVFKGKTGELGGEDSKIALELATDVGPGTYKGKADLAPDDPEAGGVELELKVSRSVWLAALLILAGILVGIVLLSASGRMLPKARLTGKAARLSSRYAKATSALSDAGGGTKSWTGFRIKNLKDLRDQIEEKISEAGRKVVVKIEDTVVQNIEAEITAVETQIDLLKEIPKHAPALEEALLVPRPGFLPPLKDGAQPQGQSALEKKAAAALVGRALDAGALKAAIDEMDSRAREMATLRRTERNLEEMWIERQPLQAKVDELDRRFSACRSCLWAADGTEGLEKAAKLLEQAQEELIRVRRDEKVSERELSAVESSALGAAKLAPLLGGTDSPPVQTAPLPPAPPAPVPAEEASAAVNTAFWVQVGIVVLTAALALGAGLEALYVGKAWGTTGDLLAAFLWGVIGQALVSSLVTNLDGLWGMRALRRS